MKHCFLRATEIWPYFFPEEKKHTGQGKNVKIIPVSTISSERPDLKTKQFKLIFAQFKLKLCIRCRQNFSVRFAHAFQVLFLHRFTYC